MLSKIIKNMSQQPVTTYYPTLSAAAAQFQSCPYPATDQVTYVPKTVLTKHIKNIQVHSYEQQTTFVPVAQATAVQVVQHPTETICQSAPAAVAAAPCGPCGSGFGGVGSGVPVGFNQSKVGSMGGFSQTMFQYGR